MAGPTLRRHSGASRSDEPGIPAHDGGYGFRTAALAASGM